MIRRATVADIYDVAGLFDEYRQFYRQSSNVNGARDFLAERLARDESVIFLATQANQSVGFAQLYPSFSSLSMRRTWILSDLFVSPLYRKQGVGGALLDECKRLAVDTGAEELILETMTTNSTAQRLYEGKGWKRDHLFYTYHLAI